jgi:hypothetical protein
MSPEKFALAVGVVVFAGGSLGLVLHRVLPEKHITGGGKDVIGAVRGTAQNPSAYRWPPPGSTADSTAFSTSTSGALLTTKTPEKGLIKSTMM